MKSYAGIGSRETPSDVLMVMTQIATLLQDEYTLRSGHAPGADSAFENGCTNSNMEIYIPWKGFGGSKSTLFHQNDEAMRIASEFHPNWKNLKMSVRNLMARNVHQVLGKDLQSPSDFVLCWTPDGCESHKSRSPKTGGTGQAISIASSNGIEVINMKTFFWKERLEEITGINYEILSI